MKPIRKASSCTARPVLGLYTTGINYYNSCAIVVWFSLLLSLICFYNYNTSTTTTTTSTSSSSLCYMTTMAFTPKITLQTQTITTSSLLVRNKLIPTICSSRIHVPQYTTTTSSCVIRSSSSSGIDSNAINPNDEKDMTITQPSSSSTTTTLESTRSFNSNDVDITNEQRDFIIGYMNKHHIKLNIEIVRTLSNIGSEMKQSNVWSGNSYIIINATCTNLSLLQNIISYNVTIQKRKMVVFQNNNDNDIIEERFIQIPLNIYDNTLYQSSLVSSSSSIIRTNPSILKMITGTSQSSSNNDVQQQNQNQQNRNISPIDDTIRLLCKLCWYVQLPSITGKFIQLGIQLNGIGIGQLPENMYLNQVPHNVYVRQYFYDKVSEAIYDGIQYMYEKKITNRQKIITLFPETNPSMDSYRIGTLLELIRTVTLHLVQKSKLRVRICVQNSMGVGIFTGLPKQLNGVAKLLQLMDWQNEIGESNEGILGNYVRFGAIGPDHVYDTIRDTFDDTIITQHQDDVFIIVAPQSMVGTDTSIIPLLSDMVNKIGNDRPILLFNPDLTDKISSGGQQSIRGRQDRINFVNTFDTLFHFQNIYISGTSYFPILGAITKLHPIEPWIAHQRRDYSNNNGEIYIPVLAGESMPDGDMILDAFER